MAPSIANIEINQKSDFKATLYVRNTHGDVADLTNYTVSSKYKRDYFEPDEQAKEITAEITNPLNGEITISLTPDKTALLHVQQRYVYDVTVIDDNDFKSRILEGRLIVSGGVS